MKISVIGCGYLGADPRCVHGRAGPRRYRNRHRRSKIASLSAGRAPFRENGLDDLLAKHTASGRLRFTQSFSAAADFADVHFLTVGTPQLPGSNAHDLSFLFEAAGELAARLRRPSLIVGKSTVPPGTAARLEQFVHKNTPMGTAVQLAWNPEFLRESSAVDDTLRPDRIVVGPGKLSTAAEQTIRSRHAPIIQAGTPVIVTDFATSESTRPPRMPFWPQRYRSSTRWLS